MGRPKLFLCLTAMITGVSRNGRRRKLVASTSILLHLREEAGCPSSLVPSGYDSGREVGQEEGQTSLSRVPVPLHHSPSHHPAHHISPEHGQMSGTHRVLGA